MKIGTLKLHGEIVFHEVDNLDGDGHICAIDKTLLIAIDRICYTIAITWAVSYNLKNGFDLNFIKNINLEKLNLPVVYFHWMTQLSQVTPSGNLSITSYQVAV